MTAGAADPLAAIRSTLLEAEMADSPAECYLQAQLAALRVAAVVLERRARATKSGPRNAWRLLASVAPELAEWAGYFAALQPKRQAVAAGATAIVSRREAEDLVRDVWAFVAAVRTPLLRTSAESG